MKLKLDDKDQVVTSDGKPVYVDDNGREIVFDYDHTVGTITRLNGEAKSHREAKQALEEKLKAYEGIEDPDAARAALETVQSLASGDLMKAGKVDEIKAEAKRAYDEQLKGIEKKYEPVISERDTLRNELHQEKIGGSFSRSQYITDKLAIPADLVQAAFGKYFTLQDGKIVAKDASGGLLYSQAKPGDLAGFDEALEILVNGYANRDSILKGSGASGSGAGGNAGANGGKKTMTRAAFEGLPPLEQANAAREATIVD